MAALEPIVTYSPNYSLGDYDMSNNDDNNGHDGFVWSSRMTMAVGFLFALALAAARFAPILAVPLEWQR